MFLSQELVHGRAQREAALAREAELVELAEA
jgi:hypothetical protein